MDISIIVLFLVCMANLSLGLFVLMRDPRSPVTRSFFVLSVFISIWAGANYLTDNAASLSLNTFANRLAYSSGFLAIATAAIFSRSFTTRKTSSRAYVLSLVCIALAAVFSLTNYVGGNVRQAASGELSFTSGPLITVYVAMIGVLCLVIAHNFYGVIRTGDQMQRNRAKIITASLILSIIIGTLLNAVIPAFSENFHSAKFGPSLLSLFFISTISYAIVKHKLFDIRLVVARSFAYILSLLSLAAVFVAGAFTLTSLFFNQSDITTLRWIYTVLAVITAFIFAPLKQFFDRATNHFFFRDAYDTQAFLDEFNKTLVETYELDRLLKDSIATIERNIKPAYCLCVVNGTEYTRSRAIGSGSKSAISEEDIRGIQGAMSHMRKKLIVTDELDTRHEPLQKHLQLRDIVIIARLSGHSSSPRSDVGYLMLGPKKSGNLYSAQDLKVIEIIGNELVIAIQNALRFEQIENFNLTLQAKVDEATKKLRKANEKLKELDETKDDFISMASHQLRTPLTSIKGYVSMIMEGDAGKVTHMQREMLGQAFFSSQRMVYLIADLLNVSRLKTGKFIIEPTPVNLADVVAQELGQLEETAAARSLKLTYDKPKDFPLLMIDEVKTRQVIMNFVDNAIYYTPTGGHIDVKLIENSATVELRVTDDGIGVPKSEQPHLFTKFYRAGNARKARPDGTGLGLFMAKKVVVAQNGSIIFESKEGKGSTFGFILSKHKLATKPTSATPAKTDTATAKKPVNTH